MKEVYVLEIKRTPDKLKWEAVGIEETRKTSSRCVITTQICLSTSVRLRNNPSKKQQHKKAPNPKGALVFLG